MYLTSVFTGATNFIQMTDAAGHQVFSRGVQDGTLTAAMDGFARSPGGECVTSAPRKMTGSRNTCGLGKSKQPIKTQDLFKTNQIFTVLKIIQSRHSTVYFDW